MDKTLSKEEIGNALRKILNSHGYGFQYSVVKRADSLFKERKSNWRFEVSEYPVEVKGFPTRIDFILRHPPALYLVAECKRANPALSNWCFVRAPYTRRNPSRGEILIEEMIESGGRVYTRPVRFTVTPDLYQHAFEIKTGKKGDVQATGRGTIEEAATQVCRGVNGIIESAGSHIAGIVSDNKTARLLPVIFTTAKIWTSEIDLASAELATGEFKIGSASVTERPWIWFQYNVSPGLRYSKPAGESAAGFAERLDLEYARPIAVVGPDGIDQFLTQELL